MRTLELKYTLTPSHIDAEWTSTFFVFQKPNALGKAKVKDRTVEEENVSFVLDVIITIGLLDSGCVKLWAFDPRTASSTVTELDRVLNEELFV